VIQHPKASLEYPVHANEVFVKWTARGFQKLEESGIQFLYWPGRDDLARFVFSHCTSSEETETLCARLAELDDV
jgi:threonine aldolase